MTLFWWNCVTKICHQNDVTIVFIFEPS